MLHTQPQKAFDAERSRYDHWVNGQPDKVILRRREIQYLAGGGSKGGPKGPPTRTEIKGFTPTSAGRLRRYIDNYHRDFVGMLTLTYGEEFPTDGLVVKAHLKAFFERLRRSGYFSGNSLVWWLEFQSRGAPHIHAVLTGWIGRRWAAQAWADITKGDAAACVRVESLRDADAAGSYAAKYAAKSDQKEVPPGYINVGRFWGHRGGVPGVPKCPKLVAAANPGAARERLRGWARAQERARAQAGAGAGGRGAGVVCDGRVLPSVRIYEHEGGWSIYGREAEMRLIWDYLGRLTATTSQDGRRRGVSAPPMWPESIALLSGKG